MLRASVDKGRIAQSRSIFFTGNREMNPSPSVGQRGREQNRFAIANQKGADVLVDRLRPEQQKPAQCF